MLEAWWNPAWLGINSRTLEKVISSLWLSVMDAKVHVFLTLYTLDFLSFLDAIFSEFKKFYLSPSIHLSITLICLWHNNQKQCDYKRLSILLKAHNIFYYTIILWMTNLRLRKSPNKQKKKINSQNSGIKFYDLYLEFIITSPQGCLCFILVLNADHRVGSLIFKLFWKIKI